MSQLLQQQPNELEIVSADTEQLSEAVSVAIAAEDQAKAAVEHLIRTKIIAGQFLEQKREACAHGDWVLFCESVLPISYQTANRWIGLFRFVRQRGEHALDDAKSVRQAYQLAGLLPESQGGAGGGSGQSDNAFLTDLVRTNTRICAQLAKRPLEEWPAGERTMLRERLKPLVEVYVQLNALG